MSIVYIGQVKNKKTKELDEEQRATIEPPYKAPGCTQVKRLPTLDELDRQK